MSTRDMTAGGMTAGERGFTLIEMLVALTLIGLLSAGLFSGLRFGARAWEAGGERIAATNDVEAGRAFLRRRLAQIQALAMGADRGERQPVFDGRPDSLRFAADWPVHLGHGGVYVFTLRADDTNSGLLLDWALYRPDGPVDVSDGRQRPRRLFAGVDKVSFRYFGRRRPAEDARWHDDWIESDRLPSLIQITMTGEDAETWPPIRVAVAAAPL